MGLLKINLQEIFAQAMGLFSFSGANKKSDPRF